MSKQQTSFKGSIEVFSSILRSVCVLVSVLLSCQAFSELFRFQANAPIQGFLSPFFNEVGEKTWQCSGDQVRYISESEIHLKKMCITFFCPHHPETPDMVVRSDTAQVSIPEQQAYGETLLTVTHPSYTIIGENWSWKGKRSNRAFSKIYIKKNASVMFYDLPAKEPSTVISSDRLRMLRFKDHNEFLFLGNVQIKNNNFSGDCGRMWVFSVAPEQSHTWNFKFWLYGFNRAQRESKIVSLVNFETRFSNTNTKFQQVGQIRIIIGWQQVHLETEDPVSGEKKRSFSEKAVVYLDSSKMILSENPVVYSSTQGTFRGDKIVFYRNSKHIQIENTAPGKRSQVFLGE